MAQFLTKLRVELISESPRRWVVLSALAYETDLLPPMTALKFGPRRLVVPPGFETDFASVPRIPVAWLVAGDSALAPAVLHDWLYTLQPCTRGDADRVFLEAMEVTGVGGFKRRTMYSAVRFFAARAWEKGARDTPIALALLREFLTGRA